MIQEVERYENYINSLPDLMAKSYYKADYFMTNLGLKHATYYRKLRLNNFTIAEIKKITELLFPEERLLRELQKSENDIQEGNVYEHNDVMARLKSKYTV